MWNMAPRMWGSPACVCCAKESAPAIGLSGLLVDIVQTGTTLRENDLVVLADVSASEAYLIANRSSYA